MRYQKKRILSESDTVTRISLFLYIFAILSGCAIFPINNSTQPKISGNTYYISVNGKDTHPGTQSLPWRTIQKCLDQVQPGDTCEVFGGTYSEALVLKVSGTQSARITLRNYKNQSVTVNSGNNKSLVTSGRIEYYTIEGLGFIATYTSPGQGDFTINLGSNVWDGETNKDGGNNGFIIRNCYIEGAIKFYGHNNQVENCELNGKQNWTNGLQDQWASSHDNTYRQNIIHDYNIRGIWTMQYTDNITIEGNTIYNNGEMGIDCDGAAHPVSHCFVRNNIIHDISGEGVGILLENAFDAIVDANKISNVIDGIKTLNYGPNISEVEYRTIDTHTIIRNNLIDNANKNGILCFASPGGKALNNTIYNTHQTPGYFAAIALPRYDNYYCHNWEIKNNLISQTTSYALWYESPSGGLNNLSADFNLFDFNPSEAKFVWVVYSETGENWNRYTLTQMQNQRQLEQHSISGNPLFLDASNQDFHLQFGSPAINSGTFVEVFTDFDGNPRPQGTGYDIGAFEFVDQKQPPEPLLTPTY